MKKTLLSAVFIAATLIATAQDNKPGKGTVGIWYGVSFVPVTQNVYITGYLTDHVEFGGSIGFNYNRSTNSQFSPTNVLANSGYVPAQMEHRLLTTNSTVSVAPMVLYHFNIKSNLDLGLGANLPLSISTSSKDVNTDITTAPNYSTTTEVTNIRPISIGIGAGMLISCKYFFYKNLAVGAMANLGFNGSVNKGNIKQVSSTTNTGSDNPQLGYDVSTTTLSKVNANNQQFQMLHNFSLNLSWYFDGKKKSKAATSL